MADRRILLAPDGFKGSISAADACLALRIGWHEVAPTAQLIARPMADGGEGTLDAFAEAIPAATRIPVTVTGPADLDVDTAWLLLPPTDDAPRGTGVVELAATSGIELLDTRLRPWQAHTTGFGQAIAAALDHGVSRLILGIGSSASTDGGIGMLRALGMRFTDAAHADVDLDGAAALGKVAAADASRLRPIPEAGVLVLSDVTNPLTGRAGAAAVFGSQKGLHAEEIPAVDAALVRFADVVRDAVPGADPQASGAGAAGGVGFALRGWGATLTAGADEIARLIGLDDALGEASLVITGEGSFDAQSAAGKVPAHVLARAQRAQVPVALVAGRIAGDADASGFDAVVSLSELAGSSTSAQTDPERWLQEAGRRLAERYRTR